MGIKVHSIFHVISERITFGEKAMNANGAEKDSRIQHLASITCKCCVNIRKRRFSHRMLSLFPGIPVLSR